MAHTKSNYKLHFTILFLLLLSLILYTSTPITKKGPILTPQYQIFDPFELEKLDQKDPELLSIIRSRYLSAPSKLPYNLKSYRGAAPGGDPTIVNSIREYADSMPRGFFVEVGAFDGIESHTLFLEQELGWSGLLIECNPVNIPLLQRSHRKAYLAGVCLSIQTHPEVTNFTSVDTHTDSSSLKDDLIMKSLNSNYTVFEVQSLPLYSIIAALGVEVVDVIVLDIESMELKVLKIFPFELLLVKIWVIEFYFLTEDERKQLIELMKRNGYAEPKTLHMDYVFVHKSLSQ